MKHLLIEAYCDGNEREDVPCKGGLNIGIHCLLCPRFSYAECSNELAICGSHGEIGQNDFIGFGGDMEPDNMENRKECIDRWKEICRKKIDEAYDEYMNKL